jgi:hypothetical protein
MIDKSHIVGYKDLPSNRTKLKCFHVFYMIRERGKEKHFDTPVYSEDGNFWSGAIRKLLARRVGSRIITFTSPYHKISIEEYEEARDEFMNRRRLFVHGKLGERFTQEELFGRIIEGKPSYLLGYKKAEIARWDLKEPPFIFLRDYGEDTEISGVILSLSDEELKRVDEYYKNYACRKKKVYPGRRNQDGESWIYVQGLYDDR